MNGRMSIIVLALAVFAIGCEQEPVPEGKPNPEPEIPAAELSSTSAEGLVFEHIGFDDSDPEQGRAARIRVTNQTTAPVESVQMQLVCYDDEGTELSKFPWEFSQPSVWLRPGEIDVINVGHKLSESVTKVKVLAPSVKLR